jgi:hypothetical protein
VLHRKVRVLRQPAHAPEAAAWVLGLVRQATRFPETAKRMCDVETWRVDASGQFELRRLTQGQRQGRSITLRAGSP